MILLTPCPLSRRSAETAVRRRTSSLLMVPTLVCLLAVGCAQPFPSDLLAKVEKSVSYREFQDEPEKYDGKLLMFGGEIVETKNTEDRAWVVVLQRPLKGDGRPSRTAESGGRFLLVTKSYLDVGAFQQGHSITVIGEVDGSNAMPLRGTDSWYPLLVAKQLHLW